MSTKTIMTIGFVSTLIIMFFAGMVVGTLRVTKSNKTQSYQDCFDKMTERLDNLTERQRDIAFALVNLYRGKTGQLTCKKCDNDVGNIFHGVRWNVGPAFGWEVQWYCDSCFKELLPTPEFEKSYKAYYEMKQRLGDE